MPQSILSNTHLSLHPPHPLPPSPPPPSPITSILPPKTSNPHRMGQTLSAISDKLGGKSFKDDQINSIANKVFDRIKGDADKASLSFDDLHIAVLYVYNDINKYLPGSHNDPPSNDELKAFMQEFDMNLDGHLDRVEFVEFVKKLTSNIATSVGRNLLITLIAAPTVALLTKRATEDVPGVGKVVQKVPNSVYASLVTVALVLVQSTVNQ